MDLNSQHTFHGCRCTIDHERMRAAIVPSVRVVFEVSGTRSISGPILLLSIVRLQVFGAARALRSGNDQLVQIVYVRSLRSHLASGVA